jgi:hypothetical protein
MNILRAMLISLAGFVCIIAISGSVYLLTLQTTIMDRTVVKGWLGDSKIYDGKLISAFVQTTNAGGGQGGNPQSQANISASPEAIKTALNATFTPDFVQTQIEAILNNAYDWTENKTPEFTFSIPIDQKRDTLIQQLSKAVEPQIAALPICRSTQQAPQSTCRPSNVTIEQFASQLTTQSIDESGAFAAPITNESISKNNQKDPQQSDKSPLTQLPAIRAGIDMLLIILPIAAIVSIAIVILATATGRRLAASSRLSRRIFFSMLLTLIPAIAVIWIARDHDFGLSNMFAAQIGELVIPLIKTIIVGIAHKLALLSGIVCGTSAAVWIGLTIWQRKRQVIEVAQVPAPIPPADPVQLPQQPQNFN